MASVFQTGISQNTKCVIKNGFHRDSYFCRSTEGELSHMISVITHLKSLFPRFDIPAAMVIDNGPQFSSNETKEFSDSYGFWPITTSPHYPQSNALAEKNEKCQKPSGILS